MNLTNICVFFSDLTKSCGFTKATCYALTPLMINTFKKGSTKDKLKYCNTIAYKDNMTSHKENILGVASVGMLCQQIVFESIAEMQAPGLLRAQPEDMFNVSLQEHKIGIIVKNSEGEPKIMLQVEYNSTRAKKKPLNVGDVNLLKICLMIVYERLQKFVILAQAGTKRQSLGDIISFVLRTARYESHKELGRNIENDLK